jgi:flavin-dependent dehydrogenase
LKATRTWIRYLLGSTMLELDIIIVGAGISGLASAIALSRAGHNVQVSTVGPEIEPNN